MNSLASQMHGSSCANDIHGSNAVLGFEDMEGKDDDGQINIDDWISFFPFVLLTLTAVLHGFVSLDETHLHTKLSLVVY